MKIVIKFKNQTVTFLRTEHGLSYENMKKQIETDIVEHLVVRIGERNYDAWLCEEGLLRNLKPEAIMYVDGKPYNYLAGTVLLSLTDDDGYACGLEQEDVDYVKSKLRGASMSVRLQDDEMYDGDFPIFEYGY